MAIRLLFSLLTVLLLGTSPLLAAPADTTVSVPAADSVLSPFVSKVWQAAGKDKDRNQSRYTSGKISIRQQAIWNALTGTAQHVKLYLENNAGMDRIPDAIAAVKNYYNLVQDGIFTNKGTAQTDRNLTVSSVVLTQLLLETETYKKQTDQYTADLIAYRNTMDSLLSDPVLYIFPRDSVNLMKYLSRLKVIAAAGNPADNALNEKLEAAQKLQNELDHLLFTMQSANETIDHYRDELAGINLKREFGNLWEPPKYYRPLGEILHYSVAKEKMALRFYTRENLVRLFLLSCLVALTCIGVYSLKRRLKDNPQPEPSRRKLLLRNPFPASLIIVLSVYQFVFINAPFIFSFCIWSVQIVCLLILLQSYITRFWLKFWAVLATLFLLASLDNFVLQASRVERWYMAALSLAGIVFGIYIIFSRHRTELKERSILLFLRFLVFAELLSLLLNLFGRYNLSKTLLVAGYTGTVSAIVFLWIVRLVNEGLRLGAVLYQHSGKKPFHVNFNRMGNKAPRILYVLLFAGWCVIVGRHFYAFHKLSQPLSLFLHKDRTLGNYTFSIDGLALFLLIMVSAMLLSRIISFFADDPQAVHGNATQRPGKVAAGSWILLVRIFIISLGLFLAFAASGIPLDKITIVLGALSVGIGLGLQGLVSNLISGLILAFEKPVNVGDVIEVDGKSGIMKSIGFRSSVVSLNNGAHLVVPNGDLLNNHLVNWSNSRNARKVIVPMGIAYGSDLQQTKTLLESIARAEARILEVPVPVAVPRGFGANAINIDLVFWVKNMAETDAVTGAVILAIDAAFREHHITIPFPRQDVHVYTETPDGPETGAATKA